MSNVNDFNSRVTPATGLNLVRQSGGTGISYYIQAPDFAGCKLSSAITSATLTEVVNITGAGVFTFAGLITSTSTTSSTAKIDIEIDGATVLNDVGIASLLDSDFDSVIGAMYANATTGGIGVSEGYVSYSSSIIIKIAGDGTNGVQLAYKDYLT